MHDYLGYEGTHRGDVLASATHKIPRYVRRYDSDFERRNKGIFDKRDSGKKGPKCVYIEKMCKIIATFLPSFWQTSALVIKMPGVDATMPDVEARIDTILTKFVTNFRKNVFGHEGKGSLEYRTSLPRCEMLVRFVFMF